MKSKLESRLNQILTRVTSQSFLSSEGIGNEIACYIFDYPATEELHVRGHTSWLMDRFETHHPAVKVLHLDLLDVVVSYLKERKLFDKALKLQKAKGDPALLKALKGPLAAEKIRDYISETHNPSSYNLILLSGIGSVWPMLRAHSLLNCLHTAIGNTPLVMFYPGSFDGTTLKLFGQIASSVSQPGTQSYYRAFVLVPGEMQS
jgi:hypothetical protein